MSCPLLTLSAELQYLIFQHLKSHEDPEEPYVRGSVTPRRRDRSLADAVFDRDLRNLSLTCSFYYASLIPHTFKKLVLQNNEASASSMLRCMANTTRNYIQFTKELYFTDTKSMALAMEKDHLAGWQKSPDKDSKDDISIPELCRLPTSAAEILSNLSRFPNLDRLLIHWRFHDSDWYIELYTIENHLDYNYDIVELEEKDPWRALMRDVYNALSKNVADINTSSNALSSSPSSSPQAPILKSLEINNIPMNPVSTYLSPTFHNFLSSIGSFKLDLVTSDSVGDYEISTFNQYHEFTYVLDEYFFNHLSSATSLHITAWGGPLGGDDSGNCGRLSLPSTRQLPVLKRLVVGNCFTAPTLIDFLAAHARSLERVEFVSCFSDAQEGNTWCKLFEALARARPERLVEFCVEPARVRFRDHSWDRTVERDSEEARCEELLGGDEDEREGDCVGGGGGGVAGRRGRRAFSYAYVDDKYGFLSEIPYKNRAMFLKGEDQRAYDALMEIVERNRKGLMEAESGISV
ncbi:hypothetical protein GX51_03094 [Blastomyces parvus]|uniref:F-box domain-containing protein n=1 Tax=Blastomyces parvus TaxID=2060905 RepID=A0A2B7X8A4_9EURO|nr:hypothetical protein GX51_03094 [Blastomyces parvus]